MSLESDKDLLVVKKKRKAVSFQEKVKCKAEYSRMTLLWVEKQLESAALAGRLFAEVGRFSLSVQLGGGG